MLRDDERRGVQKHDAARAHADAFRFARDMADDDRSRRARNARNITMLGQPVAMVAPLLGMLRQIDGVPECERVENRRENHDL